MWSGLQGRTALFFWEKPSRENHLPWGVATNGKEVACVVSKSWAFKGKRPAAPRATKQNI